LLLLLLLLSHLLLAHQGPSQSWRVLLCWSCLFLAGVVGTGWLMSQVVVGLSSLL
jgi:hypothetical protein